MPDRANSIGLGESTWKPVQAVRGEAAMVSRTLPMGASSSRRTAVYDPAAQKHAAAYVSLNLSRRSPSIALPDSGSNAYHNHPPTEHRCWPTPTDSAGASRIPTRAVWRPHPTGQKNNTRSFTGGAGWYRGRVVDRVSSVA